MSAARNPRPHFLFHLAISATEVTPSSTLAHHLAISAYPSSTVVMVVAVVAVVVVAVMAVVAVVAV